MGNLGGADGGLKNTTTGYGAGGGAKNLFIGGQYIGVELVMVPTESTTPKILVMVEPMDTPPFPTSMEDREVVQDTMQVVVRVRVPYLWKQMGMVRSPSSQPV